MKLIKKEKMMIKKQIKLIKKIKVNLVFIVLSITMYNSAMAQFECKSWEAIKTSGPELKKIGLLITKSSKQVESSPWSVGCETLDRDYAIFNNYKDYVGQLGVSSARLQGGWAKCEKEKGVYNFAWLDSSVYGLSEQGVNPWICLCYGNPLYDSGLLFGSKIFTSDETMDAWLRWVEATVTRYKDVVPEWEIWNEPNGYGGGAGEYADLLMRTTEIIKSVQQDAVILGFSLQGTGLKFVEEVFEILKEKQKLDIIDYFTYHPYYYNPDKSNVGAEKLRSLVHSYNPDIKMFQGECGVPSMYHEHYALKDYPWTEISQAKWYLRRMAGDRVRDIRTSVFTIIDYKYPEVLLSMGLLRSNLKKEVVYKKPAYYTVQHMVSSFDNTVIPVGELKYESNSTRTMTVAGFEKEGKPVVLIWYNDEIPGDDLEWDLIDLTIKNTNFKDPVYVDLMSGYVYEIDNSKWKNKKDNAKFRDLPVWDGVIMIAERKSYPFCL